MYKRLLIAALLAVLLAGCAHRHHRGDDKVVNQTNPQISVGADGRIDVPYALIYLGRREVTVTWRLSPDSKYRFADNGIVIEGVLVDQVIRGDKVSVVLDRQDEIVNCRRGANGLEFSCLNRHTKPGYYKYTIRLVGDSQKPLTLDPGMLND